MITLGLGKEWANKTQNMLQIKKKLPNTTEVRKSQKPTEGSHTLGKDENKNIS